MIASLKGVVAAKSATEVVIDVNGVGYCLTMPSSSISQLPQIGSEASVLCKMIVSDSSISLYGFIDDSDRTLFEDLVTVSGIGPKTAMAALSFLNATQLRSAIVAQDLKVISKIPGIGKKSASRILLELKDKYTLEDSYTMMSDSGANVYSEKFSGIAEALSSMGFSQEEVSFALENADENDSESMVLQSCLKKLAK